MNLEYKGIDENTYSIGNIEFNFSKYIKNQSIRTEAFVCIYSYDKSYESLEEKISGAPLQEKENMLKVIIDRINFIEQRLKKVDEYLNLVDINEIHMLKLINLVTNKNYKDVSNIEEEVKKLNSKELLDTYESLKEYNYFVKMYGDMTIELDNLYSCKNAIKKNS